MYGSERTDPLVKYYDETLATAHESEFAWFRERVRRFGGPVLDLACGTGRFSILLAREGYRVTAVDQSEGMLAQLASKLAVEPDAVRERVEVHMGSMSALDVGGQYNTVICCDAFFHNLTVEDEMACLQGVARHLTPGGRFLFNLPNPTCEFLLNAARREDGDFGEPKTYLRRHLPGSISVERRPRADLAAQLVETTLRFTVFDEHGAQVERTESTWTTRYLWRYEAEHLLYRCGFVVEELVGGYGGQAVGEAGQLVFQARLAGEG